MSTVFKFLIQDLWIELISLQRTHTNIFIYFLKINNRKTFFILCSLRRGN